MPKIGLFYGAMGGYTKNVAELIKKEFGNEMVSIKPISKSSPEDLISFNVLIFGAPTYQHGRLDDHWDDFLPKLAKIDFTGKKIALFMLGNAVDFPDSFAGSGNVLADIVKKRGAKLVGLWEEDDYEPFDVSMSSLQNGKFVGLVVDEMSQPEKSAERVGRWVKQIRQEFGEV